MSQDLDSGPPGLPSAKDPVVEECSKLLEQMLQVSSRLVGQLLGRAVLHGAYARSVRRIPARGQGGIQPGAHHGGESSLCPAAPADVHYTAICSAYNAKCGTRLAARWMPNWSAILSAAPLASGSRGDSSGVDLTGQAKRQAAKRRQSAGAKSVLAVGRTTRMLLDVTIGPKGRYGRLIRTDSVRRCRRESLVTARHERPQACAVRLHSWQAQPWRGGLRRAWTRTASRRPSMRAWTTVSSRKRSLGQAAAISQLMTRMGCDTDASPPVIALAPLNRCLGDTPSRPARSDPPPCSASCCR